MNRLRSGLIVQDRLAEVVAGVGRPAWLIYQSYGRAGGRRELYNDIADPRMVKTNGRRAWHGTAGSAVKGEVEISDRTYSRYGKRYVDTIHIVIRDNSCSASEADDLESRVTVGLGTGVGVGITVAVGLGVGMTVGVGLGVVVSPLVNLSEKART